MPRMQKTVCPSKCSLPSPNALSCLHSKRVALSYLSVFLGLPRVPEDFGIFTLVGDHPTWVGVSGDAKMYTRETPG